MVCSDCHERIPANQSYWLEPVGYGTRTTCLDCKPPVYGEDDN